MRSLLLNACEVELLTSLLRQGVRFLVVGGHAVIFHGNLRPAKDLDLFVDREPNNATRIVSALLAVGLVHPDINENRFSLPDQQVRINGMFNTELLTSITGLSFEEAFSSCAYAHIQQLSVPVLSLPHLVETKRVLGRPQDLEDIVALERVNGAL